MNKRLVSELVKVANSLDVMGFNKEANSLDRIARKILSQDTTTTTEPTPTGVYKDDISTYKKLLFEDDNVDGADKFLEAVKLLTDKYDEKTLVAFEAQANRLKSMVDFSEEDRNKSNEDIYKLIHKNKLDEEGIDENEFQSRWDSSKLDTNNEQVKNTYDLLKAKFPKTTT
jgi:Fe-S-cluster formation regulator IscX/YfhJ